MQGRHPRVTLRDEGTDDGHTEGPSGPTTQVSPMPGTKIVAGGTAHLGLLARNRAQPSSSGQVAPVPILPEVTPNLVSISRPVAASLGGSASSTNPHPGELERYTDTLLQRNTISMVIQMATALALQ